MYRVSPNESKPTHHIKLSKDGQEVGLILVDAQGNATPKGISRQNYPQSALKIYSGAATYDDTEPPFKPISQEDWSGGRGLKVFEKDQRRYADGRRANTLRSGKVLPAGQETYTNYGIPGYQQDLPGNLDWYDLIGASAQIQRRIQIAGPTFDAYWVQFWIGEEGNPSGNFTIEILADSGGLPGSVLKTITSGAQVDFSSLVKFYISGGQTFTTSSFYWLRIKHSTGTVTDHYKIGINPANSVMYYRLRGDQARHPHLFEYKRALYAVATSDYGAASTLWINGDRGVADSNTGELDKLKDSSKSWAGDAHNDGIVLIIAGPGSEEAQPWRTITDTYSTYLEVSPAWNVTHTTETVYVILGSNYWTYLQSLSAHVTDLAVTDEFIYFARGESAGQNILRYQGYRTSAGDWTVRTAAESVSANLLLATRHPTKGSLLWGSRNSHSQYGTCVFKAQVPPAWGDLYTEIETLADTDQPWDAKDVSYITQGTDEGATKITVADGFATGIAAVENLPDTVDVTKGKRLGLLVNSDIAVPSMGDLRLWFSDMVDLGAATVPVSVKQWDITAADVPVFLDCPSGELTDGLLGSQMKFTGTTTTTQFRRWATTRHLLICSNKPFNVISVYIATGNSSASNLYVYYFDGSLWQSVGSINDGTASGSNTMGVSGDVSFTAPENWKPCTLDGITGYWVYLAVSADLTDNMLLEGISLQQKQVGTWFLPVLNAGEWAWCTSAIGPLAYPLPNGTAIQSVGLEINTDLGAQVIKLHGGIKILAQTVEYIKLPAEARITGLEVYSSSTSDRKETPWIFTENAVFEIQNDEGVDLPVPLLLRELHDVRSEKNGRAHTVNGVYLYFSLNGEKIERYYNAQLDDVGPDLDEGLPAGRRGDVVKLVSYPGMVLAAIDAGSNGYSSVLARTEGWHELYRSPYWRRIRDMYVQAIDGQVDRMWVSVDTDLVWLPISINPETESGYTWTHEAILQSARLTAGLQDVEKFWHSLKLVSEGLVTGGYPRVRAEYRIDSEATWHALPDVFDVSPFQEIAFSESLDTAGKWLEYRLRLETNDNTAHAVVYGTVVKSIIRQEVKTAYALTFRLKDHDIDLNGVADPEASYKRKLDLLDSWVGSSTPTLMNSISEIADGSYVFPEPLPAKPLSIIIEPETHEETYIFQMTLLAI